MFFPKKYLSAVYADDRISGKKIGYNYNMQTYVIIELFQELNT